MPSIASRQPRYLPTRIACVLLAVCLLASGCLFHKPTKVTFSDQELDHYKTAATQIDYPDVETPFNPQAAETVAPILLDGDRPPPFWDLTLEEVIHIALENSTVLRDLGGGVVASNLFGADNVRGIVTTQLPALTIIEEEKALAAFDASFATRVFYEKNDRQVNTALFAADDFLQDLGTMRAELRKRAVAGTQLAIRHNVDYDHNNTPGNPFTRFDQRDGGVWQANIEAEFRQPLLQGFGVQFNRIAGPNATSRSAATFSGVLIRRLDSDVALTEFEAGVIRLVNDVENQYWELYFAYRDLDAKQAARDRALKTWQSINERFQLGQRGGEAEKEAQAREQYFRLDQDVKNALIGKQLERSRTIGFRGTGGVHTNERRLRLLMGIPVNDGRLIRPAHDPALTRVAFPWEDALQEALYRRPELRAAKWRIKKQELSLTAAHNFLLPKFDAVGRYRWRGLGRDLIFTDRMRNLGNDVDPNFRSNNAYADLTSGDYQEWQLGFELDMPLGFREAHGTIRQIELDLARQRTLLAEAEREVTHDLSGAVSEMNRAYQLAQDNFNRRLANKQQLAALEALYQNANPGEQTRLLDLILDAQRRLAESESAYYQALAEHAMAIKRVHFEKGSLLDYNEVFLAEGPWPSKAYHDAARRDHLRSRPLRDPNYILAHPPPIVTPGSYPQQLLPPSHVYGEGPRVETLPQPLVDPAAPPTRVLPPPEAPEPAPAPPQ